MSLKGKRIGFIGAGAMAGALAGGLVEAGVDRRRIAAADPDRERCKALSEQLGIRIAEHNGALVAASDVVVVAVKPDIVRDAIQAALAEDVDPLRPLWISIAAGVQLAKLEAAIGDGARVVRAMPNTPALVGCGATAVCANARADGVDRAAAVDLFASVGMTWECPQEALMDAVTGLSGSGPAYVFLLLEALVEGGIAEGLPAEAALDLSLQTVLGAAQLARETGRAPAELREQVTSRGGTTHAGLETLRSRGFPQSVTAAVASATARSRELGE